MLTSPSPQAEASPAVLALIAQGDAANLAENNLNSSKDRNALVALRALIDSKLAAFNEPVTPDVPMDMDVDGGKELDEPEIIAYPSDEELKGQNLDADEGEGENREDAADADEAGDTEMSDEADG